MDLQLTGKVALVTGASRGLGYACASALAQEGAIVSICSRNLSRVSSAAQTISQRTNSKVLGTAADITVTEDLEKLVRRTQAELGPIEILVMSTAHPPTKPFSQATEADWDLGNSLLLKPFVALTHLVLPSMQRQKQGRILYLGSIFGVEPEATSVIQSTFRTALNALAKCISNDTASDGICVNVICPGYFNSPLVQELAMNKSAREGKTIDSTLHEWSNAAPAHCLGEPENLGALVAFLASPLAKFITGTKIVIDGGFLRGL